MKRIWGAFGTVLVVAVVSLSLGGCGNDSADGPGDTTMSGCEENAPNCFSECGSDRLTGEAECIGSQWVCKEGVLVDDCPPGTCWGMPFPGEVCGPNGWECQPDCSGLECGSGPVCGESCGTCGGGKTCEAGLCVAVGPTWTDPTSGLTWQVTPTGGTMNWSDAKAHCAGLSLDGGGWHLPDIGELRSLIRGCANTELGSGTCKVEEGGCLEDACNDGDLCDNCSYGDGPTNGCYWPDEMEGGCGWYFSSSAVEDLDGGAWGVHFGNGGVDGGLPGPNGLVRCVH